MVKAGRHPSGERVSVHAHERFMGGGARPGCHAGNRRSIFFIGSPQHAAGSVPNNRHWVVGLDSNGERMDTGIESGKGVSFRLFRQIPQDLLCENLVDFPVAGTGWERPVSGLW